MCGIAGIIHAETPKPVDPVRVKRMCEALVHRGPDGEGVWTAHGIGLGHQRLSVIDLAGSPQPMLSADGRAVITFNGEIYNYRALRRELEQAGARFATAGDTEVILAAWQRWGAGCLQRLDGMFAFVLYDLEQRKVLLARDRFGVKPLYLARLSDGGLAFASELKGLLAHPLLRRRLNPAALDAFLT
ncbi:MAG: asparagine synthetase B, partial [Pseudomonadota bacterium]